jgi:hypothetical protein
LSLPFAALAQAGPLERFPIEVHAGNANPSAAAGSGGGAILPDLPFAVERGYGYVGGTARALSTGAVRGGSAAAPLTWREGPKRYSFHVPNGDYLLALAFFETETAHPGVRVFTVRAEGEELAANLDIAREAGDFRWLALEGRVPVRDGWLDLDFESLGGELKAGPGGSAGSLARLEARVSRLRIEKAGVAAVLPAPALRAEGEYLAVRLSWDPLGAPGIAGYGIFRADSESGPFESLTEAPILDRQFIDDKVARGRPYRYRAVAYGLDGGQSAFSEIVRGAPKADLEEGPKRFDLRVAEADLARLETRAQAATRVAGTLLYYGRSDEVRIAVDADASSWQFRRSYTLDLESGRRFHHREALRFLAEAGEPTLLREMLYFRLAADLGLAAPQVSPAHLLLNGRYLGVFLNREVQDERFCERALLDATGTLERIDLRGGEPPSWAPPSESARGGGGGKSRLAHFIQELERVDEGEIEAYFEERFYLDRLIDRLALAAISGREPGKWETRLYLGDSRNGKWEFLPDRAPEGAFGVRAFQKPISDAVDEAWVDWALGGPALGEALLPAPGWQLIETRFFLRPRLRNRFLDRIEALYREKLGDAVFDARLAECSQTLAPLASQAERLWPFDGGATFREGPESVRRFFRAHRRALEERIESERAREPEPLVLSEFLLRPSSGETAWVEVWNRSAAPVDLGAYRLSADPARPGPWALPASALAAGHRRVITLGVGSGEFHAPFKPSPNGGAILLSKHDARARSRLADAVFYGHQTEGRSYGRLEKDRWGFQARPTPGEANAAEAGPEPPSWKFSWGIEAAKDDGFLAYLKPGGKVKEALLAIRMPEREDFELRPMAWDGQAFRYQAELPRLEGDPSLPFYFLVRSEGGIERTYPLTGSELTFYTPSRPKLFINEVLPRPSRGGPFREFVEIYNAGDVPASLEGMYLSDRKGNTAKWRLAVKEPVPAKGFVVLYADGLGEGHHASFRLANSGEYLGLFHRYEEGNVLVDQMTFSAVLVDQSWGRREDGKKGFRRWKDPTPGKRNLPKIPEEYLKKKGEGGQSPGALESEPEEEPEADPGRPGEPGGDDARAEGEDD